MLLNACDSAGEVATLAYTSTRTTEARFGAAAVHVDPGIAGPGIGFTKPAFIYPCRLVAALSDDLLRMTGRLVQELPALRTAIRAALGFGTGTSVGTGYANGSWRGIIVMLAPAAREDFGFSLGVVVTEPGYSNQQRYQLIVPVHPFHSVAEREGDLIVATEAEWVRSIAPGTRAVLVAAGDVQAVFHPTDIESDTGVVVDDLTMQQIEAALARLFLLSEPGHPPYRPR